MPRFLFSLVALLLLAPLAQAQTDGELRRVVLVNGDVYVGVVADESADPVVVQTTDGLSRSFARSQVELIAPLINGRFFRTDPVRTRFTFAPTARTLGAGRVRTDFYPSVTVGLGDRVDLLVTGFVQTGDEQFSSPLLGVKGQVYASDRAQVALGASGAVSVGGGSGYFAIPYVIGTFGDETQAVTVGAGGLIGGVSGDVDVANGAIVGLGYERQLNNGVKIFVEGLTAIGDGGSGLVVIPGVRLFGDSFAFDIIGFIATDFEDVYGFAPIPARISYRF